VVAMKYPLSRKWISGETNTCRKSRARISVPRMRREDVVAIVLCLAYFVMLYNYVNLQAPVRIPFSPDENSVLSTSGMLIEKQTIFWKSSLNEKYGVKFFRPRSFTEITSNTYVTTDSIGFVLLIALAMWLRILPFIVPITAAVAVLAAYGAIAQVYDKRAGLLVAAILGTLPTFVFFSNAYFDLVPSLSFYLISLVALMKYVDSSKILHGVLSSLFLAISILLRPYTALFIAGYIAAIIVMRKRVSLKSFVISSASLPVFLVPVFILNQYAYGAPFKIGLTTTINVFELLTSQALGFSAYWIAFLNHIVLLAPVLFVSGTFGCVGILKRPQSPVEKALLAHLVAVSAISFAAYGFLTRTYSFYEPNPAASVSRYLMPVYLLLACCSYIFVKAARDKGPRWVSTLIISILMISLVGGSFASNALPSLLMTQQRYSAAEQMIHDLPPGSVVFTRTFDKLVFPLRDVALVYTNSDLADNPDLRFHVPIVNIDTEVIPVIRKLLIDGVHVFLTEDVDDLADHLVSFGYLITRLDGRFGLREVSLGET